MASEVAQPEVINPPLPNDAPMTNGDHEQNAEAFHENAALSKTETALNVNNISADANPGGPTPIEDVAPGITPVADFIPKDAPASHPTPPPDEPLAVSEANVVDTEMTATEDAPQPDPIMEGAAAIASSMEPTLVRHREDDDDDDGERAAKRSKVDGTSSEDAGVAAVQSTKMEIDSETATAEQPSRPDDSVSTPALVNGQPSAVHVPMETQSSAEVPVASLETSMSVDEKPVESEVKPPESEEQSQSGSGPAVQPAGPSPPTKPSYSKEPMTMPQLRFLQEKMKNLKKTKNSVFFLNPVDFVALGIPSYPDIVKNPMDLNTMDGKLKAGKYHAVQDFVDDFELIISNTRTFNGDTHQVTQTGYAMQSYFRKMMEQVPSATQVAPPKPQPKKSSPRPSSQGARRESRSAAVAVTPTAPGNAGNEAFALQADGTPQIRRDSTINRPARAIKPPPARELTYSKPKRKEHQLELKFCEHVLDEVRSPRYRTVNAVFLQPVDPVALNIPHYRQVVKQPMDLSTMAQKLKQGQYSRAGEFKKDFDLMIHNCTIFNPLGNPVRDMGIQFQREFNELWKGKEKWERSRKAQTQRGTSASADEESGEDEDDEEDEETEAAAATIRALQKQLSEMQDKLASVHKKSSKKSKGGTKSSKKTGSVSAASKQKASTSAKSKPAKKVRQVTYEEKQEISEAVSKMNGEQVERLTNIITSNVNKYADQEEMELEIDDLPNDVQSMLLKYVRSIFGNSAKNNRATSPDDFAAADDDDFEPERSGRRGGGGGGGAKRKKHKPMGKEEQQATINNIQKQLSQFQNPGVSASQSPAEQPDSSGDESEESEEE